jgi:hypothetical protein
MKTFIASFGIVLLSWFIGAGCSEKPDPLPGAAKPPHHEHHPLHGGAPVELGEEQYHVEFVRDGTAGKMQAYVFDGELENFVRIAAPSLTVVAQVSGQPQTLTFNAVANNATGEKIGDTSYFIAEADWLKTNANFDAVLKEITVRGSTFTNIEFNFPKGSDENKK